MQARTLIQKHFAGLSSSAPIVVIHASNLTASSPTFRTTVANAEAILRSDSRITTVVPPRPGVSISRDGHTALIVAGAKDDPTAMVAAADRLKGKLRALGTREVGVSLTGASGMWSDFNAAVCRGRRVLRLARACPRHRTRSCMVPPLMYELWQTDWCPASRRVRQRLTELGIDYITRQVPVEKADRVLLRERAGTETSPTLAVPGEELLIGEADILAYLQRHEPVPAETRAHRLKAEKARRRYLEEEYECLP